MTGIALMQLEIYSVAKNYWMITELMSIHNGFWTYVRNMMCHKITLLSKVVISNERKKMSKEVMVLKLLHYFVALTF